MPDFDCVDDFDHGLELWMENHNQVADKLMSMTKAAAGLPERLDEVVREVRLELRESWVDQLHVYDAQMTETFRDSCPFALLVHEFLQRILCLVVDRNQVGDGEVMPAENSPKKTNEEMLEVYRKQCDIDGSLSDSFGRLVRTHSIPVFFNTRFMRILNLYVVSGRAFGSVAKRKHFNLDQNLGIDITLDCRNLGLVGNPYMQSGTDWDRFREKFNGGKDFVRNTAEFVWSPGTLPKWETMLRECPVGELIVILVRMIVAAKAMTEDYLLMNVLTLNAYCPSSP